MTAPPELNNGIVSALAVMVAGITKGAQGFRLDRIELRSDAMRAFERDMAAALGAESITYAADAPRRLGNVPLREVTDERAPLIGLVLDMAYTLPSDSTVGPFR